MQATQEAGKNSGISGEIAAKLLSFAVDGGMSDRAERSSAMMP
jgi:hypothetical protein